MGTESSTARESTSVYCEPYKKGTTWVDTHFTTMWSESWATFANVPVRTCRAQTKWGWSAWCGVVAMGGWVVVHRTGLGARPEGTGVVGL
eukprot:3940450-Rhodomonas_salina.1